MPNRIWKIRATGNASALNNFRIVHDDARGEYNLMTAPPNSTIIMTGEGNPPSFNDFQLSENGPRWWVSVVSMTPNPHGSYNNTNNTPNPATDTGSWQSDAVPEPLPPEGKESKESKESAGADSY